jgi:hypothetical protein
VHRAWADGYNVTAVQLPLTSLADDMAVVQRSSNADELARYLIDSFQGTTLRTKLCRDRTELMSFSELALTVFCRKSFFKHFKND